jgi:tRNA(fMet)-specific endonuclease VapC
VKSLLDTNTCIAWLNATSPVVRDKVVNATPGHLAICIVVKAELLYGAHNSSRVEHNLEKLDVFFSAMDCLPFDDAAADYYARIRAFLTKSGTPVGPFDLMIAAIALSHGTSVITRNEREFRRVPGLLVDPW